MTPLRKRFSEDLKLAGYSKRTQESYIYSVSKLAQYWGKSPENLSNEDLRQYLLFHKEKYAPNTTTMALCAIKLLFEKTLNRPMPVFNLTRQKKKNKLPVILSREEVKILLSTTNILRYRALFTLIYSCGLRLREATTLKVRNIDSQRMSVKVENGKGGYDRYIPLPYTTLDLLRAYYRTHGNPILLFPGPGQGEKRESLLPVNHFLVTFTIPESLRLLARANQKLFYSLLFKAATTSLQTLAWDTRFAGGTLGMIGVLHTWSRTLVYHPHVHFIVTCGGWFEDENIWLPCKKKFLVPVKALSKIFRAKFRDYLRTKDPAIFTTINQKVWKNKWIVHSQAVGSGEDALKYLSQYVFKPAISNKRILSLEEGVVTFKYQNSNAKEWKIMKLDSLAFIRRYLMHVLPRGFVKVRYFGIYAHASHKKLQKVKMTLNTTVAQISSKLKSECPNYENQTAETKMICPKCHQHVVFIKRKNKPACMAYYPKAPPAKERMIHAIQIFLR